MESCVWLLLKAHRQSEMNFVLQLPEFPQLMLASESCRGEPGPIYKRVAASSK